MLRLFSVLLVTLGLAAACAGPEVTPDPHPALEPPPRVEVDGDRRLDATVHPTRVELDLEVDPRKDTFQGRVALHVVLDQATPVIYLHAEELQIVKATAVQGQETLDATVELGKSGGAAFVPARPLGPGEATLEIRFEGTLDEVPSSLYRVEADGHWYAFTQFEPLEARAAFPCFDEPSAKVPWQVALTVPSTMVAAANTPIATETTEGDRRTVRFATTRPMPSYLVAFAVGDFDVVEGPSGTADAVPLRILTPAGKGPLARYALAQTPTILAALTRYFGQPYPYQKLDLVAVPNFAAGAMENVGLVTFREQLLLYDPDNVPLGTRQASLSVIAHELAHMWFGDLVTMAWWDDLWLNEAFATWMASRVLTEIAPEFEQQLGAVASRSGIMGADSAATARPIKKTISHSGDIRNAFDGITYAKGAAVLQMIERWMGEDVFREGIRQYLTAHAWGNATQADLFSALDAASGKPVGATARAFVEQAGVPLVDVMLECTGGKANLKLSQSRYKPLGSSIKEGTPWHIPVCVKFDDRGKTATSCFVLETPTATVPLDTAACPAWVWPNAGEVGYYRWRLPPAALDTLITRHLDKLDTAERLALANHAQALLENGTLSGESYLKVLEALASDPHRMVVGSVMGGLGFISDALSRDPAVRDAYGRLVHRVLDDDLDRIGMRPRKDEGPLALLRPGLLTTLAWDGHDDAIRTFARKVVDRWLADPASEPLDMVSICMPIAAWDGDAALFDRLRAAFGKVQSPTERSALLRGLGNFTSPDLVRRGLGLLLDGTLRAQDYGSVVGPTFRHPDTHTVFWAWFQEHYEELVRLRGPKSAAGLPWAVGAFCDADGRARGESFFKGVAIIPDGAPQNLAQALEDVDRCIRLKASAGASLEAELARTARIKTLKPARKAKALGH